MVIMVDVCDATDAFEALARDLGSANNYRSPSNTAAFGLGEIPEKLALLFSVAVNADISSQATLDHIQADLDSIPPETWQDYPDWMVLTRALAHHSVVRPIDAEAAKELWHTTSGAPSAFKRDGAFQNGYDPSANEDLWASTVADCERRIDAGKPVTTAATLRQWALERAQPNNNAATPEELDTDLGFEIEPSDCIDIGQFDFANQPKIPFKRRPLHGSDLYRGEITVLSSAGGSAKTTWALAMAVALTTGKPLLGQQPPRPLKVLIANVEDQRGETLMRLSAVLDHHQIPRTALDNRVFVLGTEQAQSLVLTEVASGNGRERLRPEGFAYLSSLIEMAKCDVVILDPLISLIPYGLNDGGIMSTVATKLKQIAETLDCAIMLVAHTRKGSNAQTDGADATAGSSQIINRARVGLGLMTMSAAEAITHGVFPGEEWRYKKLINTKANLSPMQGERWIEIVSVGAGNATPEYPGEDKVPVAIPYSVNAATTSWITPQIQRDALGAVAQGFNGSPLSPKPGSHQRSYTHAVATILKTHLPKKSDPELLAASKAVMQDLTKRGWVTINTVPISKGSGGTNPAAALAAVWSATPWASHPIQGAFIQ